MKRPLVPDVGGSDTRAPAFEEEDHTDPLLDGSCFIGGACISFPSASALQRAERKAGRVKLTRLAV